MRAGETGLDDLQREAYTIAWEEFNRTTDSMTPDEQMFGPNRLRWYIRILCEVGERDPAKIASGAVGMLREYEQILRSRARTGSAPIAPAA
jgi:hypothetical protein